MIYLRDTKKEVEIIEGEMSSNFLTVKITSTGETKFIHVLDLVADNSIDEIINAVKKIENKS